MDLMFLILCVVFTITSSAPFGYYKRKQIRVIENMYKINKLKEDNVLQNKADYLTSNLKFHHRPVDSENNVQVIEYSTDNEQLPNYVQDTLDHMTSNIRTQHRYVDSENKAHVIEYSTESVDLQNYVTPNIYHTRRQSPVYANADTSAPKAKSSSDHQLQWTWPSDSKRWFATILPFNGTRMKSQHVIIPEATFGRNNGIPSSVPPSSAKSAAAMTVAIEKSALDERQDNSVILNQITKANSITLTPLNNNDYVAISMFDNHGHIIRRMVPKMLIKSNTVTTLASACPFNVINKIANVWQKHTV